MLVQTALAKDSRNMNGQKYSRQLAATLYPLVCLEGIRYRFRLLRVREPIPQDNLRPKRLQQWADRLWRQELRCPVYPSTHFGYPACLIPVGNSLVASTTIASRNVPHNL